MVMAPTPVRARASTHHDPTPPTPKTATDVLARASIISGPATIAVRSSQQGASMGLVLSAVGQVAGIAQTGYDIAVGVDFVVDYAHPKFGVLWHYGFHVVHGMA